MLGHTDAPLVTPGKKVQPGDNQHLSGNPGAGDGTSGVLGHTDAPLVPPGKKVQPGDNQHLSGNPGAGDGTSGVLGHTDAPLVPPGKKVQPGDSQHLSGSHGAGDGTSGVLGHTDAPLVHPGKKVQPGDSQHLSGSHGAGDGTSGVLEPKVAPGGTKVKPAHPSDGLHLSDGQVKKDGKSGILEHNGLTSDKKLTLPVGETLDKKHVPAAGSDKPAGSLKPKNEESLEGAVVTKLKPGGSSAELAAVGTAIKANPGGTPKEADNSHLTPAQQALLGKREKEAADLALKGPQPPALKNDLSGVNTIAEKKSVPPEGVKLGPDGKPLNSVNQLPVVKDLPSGNPIVEKKGVSVEQAKLGPDGKPLNSVSQLPVVKNDLPSGNPIVEKKGVSVEQAKLSPDGKPLNPINPSDAAGKLQQEAMGKVTASTIAAEQNRQATVLAAGNTQEKQRETLLRQKEASNTDTKLSSSLSNSPNLAGKTNEASKLELANDTSKSGSLNQSTNLVATNGKTELVGKDGQVSQTKNTVKDFEDSTLAQRAWQGKFGGETLANSSKDGSSLTSYKDGISVLMKDGTGISARDGMVLGIKDGTVLSIREGAGLGVGKDGSSINGLREGAGLGVGKDGSSINGSREGAGIGVGKDGNTIGGSRDGNISITKDGSTISLTATGKESGVAGGRDGQTASRPDGNLPSTSMLGDGNSTKAPSTEGGSRMPHGLTSKELNPDGAGTKKTSGKDDQSIVSAGTNGGMIIKTKINDDGGTDVSSDKQISSNPNSVNYNPLTGTTNGQPNDPNQANGPTDPKDPNNANGVALQPINLPGVQLGVDPNQPANASGSTSADPQSTIPAAAGHVQATANGVQVETPDGQWVNVPGGHLIETAAGTYVVAAANGVWVENGQGNYVEIAGGKIANSDASVIQTPTGTLLETNTGNWVPAAVANSDPNNSWIDAPNNTTQIGTDPTDIFGIPTVIDPFIPLEVLDTYQDPISNTIQWVEQNITNLVQEPGLPDTVTSPAAITNDDWQNAVETIQTLVSDGITTTEPTVYSVDPSSSQPGDWDVNFTNLPPIDAANGADPIFGADPTGNSSGANDPVNGQPAGDGQSGPGDWFNSNPSPTASTDPLSVADQVMQAAEDLINDAFNANPGTAPQQSQPDPSQDPQLSQDPAGDSHHGLTLTGGVEQNDPQAAQNDPQAAQNDPSGQQQPEPDQVPEQQPSPTNPEPVAQSEPDDAPLTLADSTDTPIYVAPEDNRVDAGYISATESDQERTWETASIEAPINTYASYEDELRRQREEQEKLRLESEEKARKQRDDEEALRQERLEEQERRIRELILAEKVTGTPPVVAPQNEARQRYVVRKNDTLNSIAARKLNDSHLGLLIYQINKNVIPIKTTHDKRIPELKEGMVIYLPTRSDIQLYRSFLSDPRTSHDAVSGTLGPVDRRSNTVENAARRQNVEDILGSLNRLIKTDCRIRYTVRLGDTVRSVAMRHPAMQDISLWILLAEVNELTTKLDAKGSPLAQLKRGDVIVIPSNEEIGSFNSSRAAAQNQVDQDLEVGLCAEPDDARRLLDAVRQSTAKA